MKKACKDQSSKSPPAKNKSVTDKTVVEVSPTNAKKQSTIDKYAEKVRSKGIKLPADISTKGQAQIFYSDGKACASVLSIDNSAAIGFFGYLDSNDDPFKWAIKAKDEYQASITATIESKLRKRFNKAKVDFAKTSCDEDVSEEFDVVDDEPVGQPDAGQPNESTEEQRDDTAVARLAVLSDFDYDRVRKLEAKRIGIRVNTLDKAVANERNQATGLKFIGPRLLSDVHEIVTSQDVDQISTTELISVLCADKVKIWSVYNRGNQIDPKQLAHILSLFGVSPRDIRFNSFVLKGYARESIVSAYSRYISSTAQPQQDDSSE